MVKEYDKLIRIDEDCYINFNIDTILSDLNNYIFIAGKIQDDMEFVTKGLNDFSIDFIKKNSNQFTFKKIDKKEPNGPYTNVFGLSLNKIRENDMCIKYINEVHSSEMIYKRRWGDLPLWGEAIYYMFDSDSMKIDANINYYHISHHIHVN